MAEPAPLPPVWNPMPWDDEDEDDDVVPAGTNNHKLCRIADPDCEACQ